MMCLVKLWKNSAPASAHEARQIHAHLDRRERHLPTEAPPDVALGRAGAASSNPSHAAPQRQTRHSRDDQPERGDTMSETREHSTLYFTGCTPDRVLLMGGIWKLWEQEGFPLEMSFLVCRDKGMAVDWLEAMADASRTNNLPALMAALETFLPAETIQTLKAGFMRVLQSGETYEQILEGKRANGSAFEGFFAARGRHE